MYPGGERSGGREIRGERDPGGGEIRGVERWGGGGGSSTLSYRTMVIRPAGLTVHTPQKKKLIDVYFLLVTQFYSSKKSGFCKGYSELKPQNVFLCIYIY